MIIGLVAGEIRVNLARSRLDQIVYAFIGFENFLPQAPTSLRPFATFPVGEVNLLTKPEVAEEKIRLIKCFLTVSSVVLDICVDVAIGEEPIAVSEKVALVVGDASIGPAETSGRSIREAPCAVAKSFCITTRAAAETVSFTESSLTA